MDDVMLASDQINTITREAALKRIASFAQQFGEAHLTLACHAAFPLVLTPDLLYRLWANFVPQAPWTAVADILLSRLCSEVGDELFEMEVATRNLLLQELKDDLGQQRLGDLAEFLMAYVAQQLESDDSEIRDLAQAQRWTALVFTQPNEAARELAEALSELVGKYEEKHKQHDRSATLIRVATLIETFTEPLSDFEPLVIYARGMASFARGDTKGVVTHFSKLPVHKNQIEVADVNLPIPTPTPRELKRGIESFPAVMVGGPPHSGKSVLVYSLSQALRQRDVPHYVLRVSPDGEGDWAHEADQALVQRIRVKGHVTPQWVARMCRDIANRHLPLLIDVGSRPLSWQGEVFDHCTHAVLLARDESGQIAWRTLAGLHDLTVLAELHSTLIGEQVIQESRPVLRGQISNLERGQTARGPTFEALVDLLADLFAYQAADLRARHLSLAPTELVIELNRLAQTLGLKGKSPHWTPDHLLSLLDYFPTNTSLGLYGRGPNWVYAALALHVYPAQFYQFDARLGWIVPPTLTLSATASSSLEMAQPLDRQTHIQLELTLPESYLDYHEAEGLTLPLLPSKKGVIISGKLPLWLWTAAVRAYREAPWVGVFQPQLGRGVVIASRNENVPIGSLVPLEQPLEAKIEPRQRIEDLTRLDPEIAKTQLVERIVQPIENDVWESVVQELTNLDVQAARDALIQALQNSDSGVRWRAASHLAKIADTRSWVALKEAFINETGSALRVYLYETLANDPINHSFIITQHVSQFIRSIEPTQEEQKAAIEAVNSLRNRLVKMLALKDAYLDTNLFGSLARGTAIHPISDIDVLVLFRINPQLEDPEITYQILRTALQRIYKSQIVHRSIIREIRQQRRFSSFGGSVLVDLPQGWLEVLPAVISQDARKQVLVPDRLLRRWIPTNHEIHAQFTQERDRESGGNYSSLIKMVKWWQYTHSPRRKYLSGFTLECLVAAHAEFKDGSLLESFEILLRQIQSRYLTYRSLRRIPEPGATSSFKETGLTRQGHTSFMKLVNETLSLTEQAQKAASLEQEIAIWQQIFGSEFPRKLN